MLESNWLKDRVLAFMTVLSQCWKQTTYAQDRHIFMEDLARASLWLVRLHNGEESEEIAKEIISPETSKRFTDYWRQGEWGEMSSKALDSLQMDIRAELGES